MPEVFKVSNFRLKNLVKNPSALQGYPLVVHTSTGGFGFQAWIRLGEQGCYPTQAVPAWNKWRSNFPLGIFVPHLAQLYPGFALHDGKMHKTWVLAMVKFLLVFLFWLCIRPISVTRLPPLYYVVTMFNVGGQFNILRTEVSFWSQRGPYAPRAEDRAFMTPCSSEQSEINSSYKKVS